MRAFGALLFLFALPAAAQWELGGTIGYGFYRNGSIIAPGGKAEAGIRNRFTAGAIIGEDLYEYLSGEVRYLYQDGDPYISSGSTRTNIQGQSHSGSYNMLFHLKPRESRIRPYGAVGIGAKYFVTTGPVPERQPLERIGVLNPNDHLRFLVTAGGGVKYNVRPHIRLRVEFLDYITPFPNKVIAPAPSGTARGILHQFSPSIGISGVF
jgi:opacity protein-like surface antigen